MRRFHFLTHPEVALDPATPITQWTLSARGLDRLRRSLAGPCLGGITAIHSSTERKATDTAEKVATHFALTYGRHPDLGENDRSSTGYLPRDEFERTADRFFREPGQSIRGWARAIDEQARIVGAVRRIAGETDTGGSTLIISHGAVGALLMADLLSEPISRRFDQPGDGGGNWFAFDALNWRLLGGWRAMEGA